MFDEATQFAGLMERVERGEQQAAWELLEAYGSHLQRYVRRSLSREMRSTRFDSVDFVQVVWASFFREPEKLRRITSPAELMAYLAALARNKVVTEVRKEVHTQKRDMPARDSPRRGPRQGPAQPGQPRPHAERRGHVSRAVGSAGRWTADSCPADRRVAIRRGDLYRDCRATAAFTNERPARRSSGWWTTRRSGGRAAAGSARRWSGNWGTEDWADSAAR